MVRPLRPDLPVLLAAEGPRNVALAREIADGWIATYYSPHHDAHLRAALVEGAARPGAHCPDERFEIVGTVPVVIDDQLEVAADRLRGLFARFIGGMGPRGSNFHFNALARLGYEGVVTSVRDLWLEGRTSEAAVAVPTAMIEAVALIGPPAKIREELPHWRGSLLSTLLVSVPPDGDGLRRVAELLLSA